MMVSIVFGLIRRRPTIGSIDVLKIKRSVWCQSKGRAGLKTEFANNKSDLTFAATGTEKIRIIPNESNKKT